MSSKSLVSLIVNEVSRHEGRDTQHDDIAIATFQVV